MNDPGLAAALLAMDPAGLGGAVLEGPPGPGRDAWLAAFRRLRGPAAERRLPILADDAALEGALDLGATLAAGRPVHAPGLLDAVRGGTLLVSVAGRLAPALAARLGAASRRLGFAVVALDEEGGCPAALADGLAFRLGADPVPEMSWGPADVARGRVALRQMWAGEAAAEAMAAAAVAGGVAGLRAAWLALRAALALAALRGRGTPDDEDLADAVRLVLAPRATIVPCPPPPAEDAPPPAPDREPDGSAGETRAAAAEATTLPPRLLEALAAGLRARGGGADGRAGATRESRERGRPVGVRPGQPRGGARLAILDTLRAAAPWQALRPPPRHGVLSLRGGDFRVRRFRRPAESTAVFVLDASGSSALHRLGEAKGAVEHLLADCYARRDRVAVVAFRGAGAETLLPPTHSLCRARRALAGLPGGGATPLAAGLLEGARLAALERRAGREPLLVLLTDGRANVGRDGARGREAAEADAIGAARALRQAGVPLLVVDTSPRPAAFARTLAGAAGGRCIPLPTARPAALAEAVRAAAAA